MFVANRRSDIKQVLNVQDLRFPTACQSCYLWTSSDKIGYERENRSDEGALDEGALLRRGHT